MNLEVLICTFNEQIQQVQSIFLPPIPSVSYLVSFQYSEDSYLNLFKACQINRSDVRFIQIKGRGLSLNRNFALKHAQGDIVLIADDDVQYQSNYFERIIAHFQSDESLDIACFQAQTLRGTPLRNYANAPFDYGHQPYGTYFSSIEIAMRRVRPLPDFDVRFGLGSPFLASGEEEIFLFDAYRQGLHIYYFPEVIVQTSEETTGERFFLDAAVQRSKGAVLCYIHGAFGAWLRCVKFVLTHCRHLSCWRVLLEMCRGILYIKS